MSILSTTKSGFKYYHQKEIIDKCCEITLNGAKCDILVEVQDDGGITIAPDCFVKKFKLYTQTVKLDDCPEHFKFKNPFQTWTMLSFVGNNEKYILTIKEPIPRKIKVNDIYCDVNIACEFELENFFDKTRIRGSVQSSVYDITTTLLKKGIHPYYGKDIVGY